MLAGGQSRRAFGLCGGISICIEVAQTNLYPAPYIACRHYAIDSNTYKPLTRQEARAPMPPSKV